MKKFMTVLLVIAVMFTFSFSTAFAVTNTEANLIKQAADYAKAQLPEAVQKAHLVSYSPFLSKHECFCLSSFLSPHSFGVSLLKKLLT